MIENLLSEDILYPVQDPGALERGSVIRRVSGAKDQQGCFMNRDDGGDLIVVNVVDCAGCSFLATAGIMRLRSDEQLYCYRGTFGKDRDSRRAMEIISNWPLYRKNADIQNAIDYFVRTAYAPAHILHLEKTDQLQHLFVPLQQKFRIGRFKVEVDWDKERKEAFRKILDDLKVGDHVTYVAMIPPTKGHNPLFYSIGTKPHEETVMSLRGEPFNFVPTHGGHIKALRPEGGTKQFLVDAGSSYLGKGLKTLYDTAREVTDGLKRVYGKYNYIPVEGRGAFGTEQSY